MLRVLSADVVDTVMCGIAGIIGPGAERRRELAANMSARIAHRGPDADGLWCGEGAVLAHRRLAIVDLSASGAQPMESHCGRYMIVFNGEIYNYLELAQELGADGVRFEGKSDTEVLLAAWSKWGVECLQRLNGMFAFAIWDSQDKHMYAARDRFGEKPFYYVQHGDCLYFASEVKALKPVSGLSWAPNPVAVAAFAAERVSDHTSGCFYAGIQQLRPGCWLRFKAGAISTGPYWSLDQVAPGEPPSDDELTDLMVDAVRIRLRADTDVGTLLSGGVDSSLVTCLMATLGQDRARYAYSTINRPPVEEARGIDAVLASYPLLVPRHDHPTAEQFWHNLPLLLWHQEEPFGDASMAAHFSLMRLARQHSVPVLLSGQGADEVFGGYQSALFHYLGTRVRFGQLSEALAAVGHVVRDSSSRRANVLLHAMPWRLARRLKRLRVHALDWLAPEFRDVPKDLDPVEVPNEDPSDSYTKCLLKVRTLPGFLHYEDRNSMAFGVETRLPFLDHRLVEAMMRVPARLRFEAGWTKAKLRKIARPWVPAMVLDRRSKMGYPAPLSRWIRLNRDAIDEQLTDRSFRECPILEQDVWHRRARQFFNGDDSQLHVFWRGYLLGRWYSECLLGDGARPCA